MPQTAARLRRCSPATHFPADASDCWRLAFDANPLPLWFEDAKTGVVLAVNRAALEQYGFSADEFLRMTGGELSVVGASDQAPSVRSGRRVCRHRRKDGTCFEVEITAAPVTLQGRAARLVLAADVSQRVRAERHSHEVAVALAQSEASFRAFVENAVFGMYRSTRDGRFTMVNQTLVDMLGYDSSVQLLGAPVPPPIYLSPVVRARLVSDAGPIDVFGSREVEWKRKDRGTVVMRVSGHAVRNERGDTVAYEAIVEDVTERRELEEQLRQSQKLEAIGLLAGGIAHDFNNHLTAILATVDMLKSDRAGDKELVDELDTVHQVSERGAELVRKLLAFGRRQRLELRSVNLAKLVGDAARVLRRVVPENIEIRLGLETDGSAVRADAGAVEQILLNLMTNARDAMPGGGTVLIQTFPTHLDEAYCASQGWDAPGEYVVLAVSDTGAGMDAETRRRAFEPFFTTKPLGRGTGLGLASVYGLAKQHGGFAHLYSEPGRGTSVKVYFPVAAPEAAAEAVSAARVVRGGTETILLAEDEPPVRRVARRALERFGYRVLEAPDGAAAFELFRQHAGEIALVLTDVVMPRVDGPHLLGLLRTEGYRRPVLFMSGYTARDIEQGAVLDPGTPLLSKPWTITDLICRVRQLLDDTAAG